MKQRARHILSQIKCSQERVERCSVLSALQCQETLDLFRSWCSGRKVVCKQLPAMRNEAKTDQGNAEGAPDADCFLRDGRTKRSNEANSSSYEVCFGFAPTNWMNIPIHTTTQSCLKKIWLGLPSKKKTQVRVAPKQSSRIRPLLRAMMTILMGFQQWGRKTVSESVGYTGYTRWKRIAAFAEAVLHWSRARNPCL